MPRLEECGRTLKHARSRWESQLRRGEAISPAALWLVENHLYIQGQLRDVREFLPNVYYGELPRLTRGPLGGYPRIYEIALELIDLTDAQISLEAITTFVESYQESKPLTMGELWALGAMLRLALIEEIGKVAEAELAEPGLGSEPRIRHSILSLRTIGEIDWKEFFEKVSLTERKLREDPAGVYPHMDFATRDHYRHVLEDLARGSGLDEEEVAERLVRYAASASGDLRYRHIGYYLIDRGAPAFERLISYKPRFDSALRRFALKHPELFYLGGIELSTFAVIALFLSQLSSLEPQVVAFFLLFLPATGVAVSFMNQLTTMLLPPRRLPKMDFSEGIPESCATMVVVPTLMLSRDFVEKLIEDLEVRFLANRDPQLSFALLTDFPDAPEPAPDDAELVQAAVDGIRRLNDRYAHLGRRPFYLFHRAREWNPKQFSFMGWERKRGKLIDFNNLLCGEENSFAVKVGDMSVLKRIKYVITLDTDTQLPRDSARKLIAAIAHPLNRPVIDPVTRLVREGYGILQPRVGISVQSAGRSRLARIYSGQTGIDLYTTAVSDVYQDLFGEGIYTGKGLYDVEIFQKVLSRRFPHDALLSHDLIEGLYARAALVSDVEVIDDYPSHYGAYSKRKHRWVRGDWQVMLWLLPRVPHYDGTFVPNPLPLISRWKIFDNLRRSLIEPTTFLLLLAGWLFLPGGADYWTLAVVLLLLCPTWTELLLSWVHVPPVRLWRAHLRETGFRFLAGHLNTLLTLTFLPHQALLMLDAIVRTIVRTITGRRLLEWESAAEAERTGKARILSLHSYLAVAALLSAVLAVLLGAFKPSEFIFAIPILALWIAAPLVAMWLNAPIRSAPGISSRQDREYLLDIARRTWRYFETFSTPRHRNLIPDNYQVDTGAAAARISPTNLGLLMNSQLAAVDLGFMSCKDLVRRSRDVMESVQQMGRFRGHFYNWYDTETLAPLWPPYVSTVDSGNLAASLITQRQGFLELAERPENAALRPDLLWLADRCAELVEEMDFSFLYNEKKKVFSTGFDPLAEHRDEYHYDLLASEARTASFIAIAKGDVPQEHWFHLGRSITLYHDQRILLSWSGTMFEYLMPALWMRTWPNTLLDRSQRAAVYCQAKHCRKLGVPWGISESAYDARDSQGNYRYQAFGAAPLALRRNAPEELVIAPYATLLALQVEPKLALRNLRRMEQLGWLGDWGFYEAVQYVRKKPVIIRSYMAHHVGMSLVALDNALNDGIMQRRFHAHPMVQATELLLQERVPTAVWISRPEPAAEEPVLVEEDAATASGA